MQTIEEFKQFFERDIGPTWNQCKDKIGKFLIKAQQSLSEPVYRTLKQWIADTYGINLSMQDVCIRVERKEIEPIIANILPASKLKNMPNHKVPRPNEVYTIYSPNVGGPVSKTILEMTEQEKRFCINQHGVITVSDMKQAKEFQPYKGCKTNIFRIEDDVLVLVAESIKTEVRFTITEQFVDEIIKLVQPV